MHANRTAIKGSRARRVMGLRQAWSYEAFFVGRAFITARGSNYETRRGIRRPLFLVISLLEKIFHARFLERLIVARRNWKYPIRENVPEPAHLDMPTSKVSHCSFEGWEFTQSLRMNQEGICGNKRNGKVTWAWVRIAFVGNAMQWQLAKRRHIGPPEYHDRRGNFYG